MFQKFRTHSRSKICRQCCSAKAYIDVFLRASLPAEMLIGLHVRSRCFHCTIHKGMCCSASCYASKMALRSG